MALGVGIIFPAVCLRGPGGGARSASALLGVYQGFIQTPQGGYNPPPSFHATPPPNHLKFKGGYQGGVYGGVYVIVMEWVINVVKY